MTFVVTRTSGWNDEVPPCDEAYMKKSTWRLDVRTVNTPEKLNHKVTMENWYLVGTDHKVNSDNHIERKIEAERTFWFVDIADLSELIQFQQKYGEIIITEPWTITDITPPGTLEIEIYDDYRE